MGSEGPNNPGTMADDDAVGTTVWDNPDNAKASDDSYSSCSAAAVVQSHYLKATNFGFSIPAGATVDGITVEIERHGGTTIGDIIVRLVDGNGTVVGDNKLIATNWVGDLDTYYTYGGAADTWNASLDDTDINDLDFGVVLSVEDVQRYNEAFVDHIRITIEYTEAVAGGGDVSGSSNTFTSIVNIS